MIWGLYLKAEPYLLELEPNKKLPSHFFNHKGEEMGFVISGKLKFILKNLSYVAGTGDIIYLTTETPTQWEIIGPEPCQMLWIKVK